MLILGIETSCDETAIALIEFYGKGIKGKQGVREINEDLGGVRRKLRGKTEGLFRFKILAEEIASQIKIHASYGGVVPMLAAREHVKNLDVLFKRIGKDLRGIKGMTGMAVMERVDLVAVTRGPGLMPSLLMGASFAKALSYKYKKPLIGINHLEGHLYSALLGQRQEEIRQKLLFPALGLIVSGGHTEIVLIRRFGSYELLGETLDDAAGEAFDKVARLLNLGYPGGPAIENAAQTGKKDCFRFPRPMINSGDYNFSFSGLKTAVLYKVRDIRNKGDKGRDKGERKNIDNEVVRDMAASFQEAIIDVIIDKTRRAIREFKIKTILAGGGVLANQELRKRLRSLEKESQIGIFLPQEKYCGDNAAMIALAAYFNAKIEPAKTNNWRNIEVNANLNL